MIFRLLTVLALSAPAILSAQARDPLVYGRAYLAEGDNAAAIDSYQEARRVNPFDPVALNNLAVAKSAAGDYQSALDIFARALQLAPQRSDIQTNYDNLRRWLDNRTGLGNNQAGPNRQPLQFVPQQVDQQVSQPVWPEPPALWTAPVEKAKNTRRQLSDEPAQKMSHMISSCNTMRKTKGHVASYQAKNCSSDESGGQSLKESGNCRGQQQKRHRLLINAGKSCK